MFNHPTQYLYTLKEHNVAGKCLGGQLNFRDLGVEFVDTHSCLICSQIYIVFVGRDNIIYKALAKTGQQVILN